MPQIGHTVAFLEIVPLHVGHRFIRPGTGGGELADDVSSFVTEALLPNRSVCCVIDAKGSRNVGNS